MPSSMALRDVSFSYESGFSLRDINLSIKSGGMVGLLGSNGSGKTTLLKIASGVLAPAHGEVLLDGASLKKLSRKEIARKIAVVPQQVNIPFAFCVGEVVMLGRTPFIRVMAGETEADRQAAADALRMTGSLGLRERMFNEISGGERQKAMLAMALAQQPSLLLLDEPTAHLDINHQIEILELLRTLNREHGMTVVAAMHDLNLAALYFDRLVLLGGGTVFVEGPPDTVLTKDTIEHVFSTTVEIARHPNSSLPHIVVLPRNNQ